MQLDQAPTTARVRLGATGREEVIAIALVLMDQPEDDGLTTGWYWTVVPEEGTEVRLLARERWTDAVRRHQGPFADGAAAIRGAGEWSPARETAAALLRQAAALVLSGETAPDGAAIASWIDGHEWTEAAAKGERPPVPPGPEEGAGTAAADNRSLLKELRKAEAPAGDESDVEADEA